jgi:hypothetical protein
MSKLWEIVVDGSALPASYQKMEEVQPAIKALTKAGAIPKNADVRMRIRKDPVPGPAAQGTPAQEDPPVRRSWGHTLLGWAYVVGVCLTTMLVLVFMIVRIALQTSHRSGHIGRGRIH